MRALISQFARFGVVGGVGFLIDLAVFNLLINTVLSATEVHEGPVFAKIISATLAIIFNWIGNRHWTFRRHRGRRLWREGIEFAIVSVGGLLIGLACLFVSHYVLGFNDKLADNISGNVIGLGLGTLFRFTFYRIWVFAPHRGEPDPVFTESGSLEVIRPAPNPSPPSHPTPGAATAPAAAAPQSD
jgi:putative flippase GtrA